MTDHADPFMPPDLDDRLDPLTRAWAPHLAHLAHAAAHLAAVDDVRAKPITVLGIPGLLRPLDVIAKALDHAASAFEIQLDDNDDSAFAMHYDATDHLFGHLIKDAVSALRLPADHPVLRCYVEGYVCDAASRTTTRLDMRLATLPLGRRSDHQWPSACPPIWSDATKRPTVDQAVHEALAILPAVPDPDSRSPDPA